MSRYIDADKLINELEPVIKSAAFKNRNIRSNVNKCWEIVNNQPTADVRENVKGEWIEDNPRKKSMMWRCSVCGRIAYYPTIGERKSYKKHCGYNYCPNCGADMRGEA